MKSIFVLLLCCGLCGCATLYPPTGVNYPSQKEIQADRTIDAERQWIDAKKAEIEQRLAEVEQAHAKGEITTAEYLTLKSNLIQEFENSKNAQAQRFNGYIEELERNY